MGDTALKVNADSSSDTVNFPCPNCGAAVINKGKMVACSKICGFKRFFTVSKKTLTLKQLETLATTGKTPVIKGFMSQKTGKPFDAALVLKDKATGTLAFDFPKLTCPNCGGTVMSNGKRANCTKNCGFGVWLTVSGVTLTDAHIKALLEKGETGIIKGFVSSKTGKTFDVPLLLADKATGKLAFDFQKK